MKKIGRGWLYVVYDLGNGRVTKIVYSGWLRAVIVFFQSGRFSAPFTKKEIQRIFKDAHAAYVLVKSADKAVLPLLGNPIFLSELEYEQDKMKVFGDVLGEADFEGKKRLVDAYIAGIQTLWSYGIADKIFNFTINNGIDKNGNIVQIDFGELSLSKVEVEQEITERSWLTSGSYLRLSLSEIGKYYKERMDKEMTVENLERYWKA